MNNILLLAEVPLIFAYKMQLNITGGAGLVQALCKDSHLWQQAIIKRLYNAISRRTISYSHKSSKFFILLKLHRSLRK